VSQRFDLLSSFIGRASASGGAYKNKNEHDFIFCFLMLLFCMFVCLFVSLFSISPTVGF